MTRIHVVKHNHDGRPPYRYEARLVESTGDWIVVEADWTLHEIVAGPVTFKPGDRLVEFFSKNDYFNAFLIHRDNGDFGGWYCNITHPTKVTKDEIHWHDLYLDVIVDESGTLHIEDEDELAASGIAESDPKLYQTILDSKDHLIALYQENQFPFSYER